jgi:hypothetical protein
MEPLFDFGVAIARLKLGQRVSRQGWNGKGMWLELQSPADSSKMTLPYIYRKTAQGDAVRWADLMESRIAEGQDDLGAFAKMTSHEADTSGITGAMYGFSVGILAKCWVHGEALRAWHNADRRLLGQA